MKKLVTFFIFIILILGAALFARNIIIKAGVQTVVKQMTGMELEVGKIDVGLFDSYIDIRNLKLYNPANYPEKIMIDLPEIYIDYNLQPMLTGKIDLDEIRLHLSEFNVVRDKNGKLNLDELKAIAEQSGSKKDKPKEQAPQKDAKSMDIQIDSLKLKVGKVTLKDYSKSAKGDIKEFNVNIDEEFKNVTDPNDLVKIIVVKSLMNTSIGSLVNFDVKNLAGSLSGVAGKALLETSKMATETLGKTTEILGGTAGEVTNKLKGATGQITDKLKLPFGK